jgi:hypothetical protein
MGVMGVMAWRASFPFMCSVRERENEMHSPSAVVPPLATVRYFRLKSVTIGALEGA